MKRITFAAASVMFLLGVVIGSTLKDARAQRSDLPQRINSTPEASTPPRAIWYMHVGKDTVGAVIVDVGSLCAPRQ